MKICQVYEDFISPPCGPQGAQRVCESITKGLLELGHEVVMKLHPDSKDAVALMVSEVPHNCDVVHFHQWEPGKRDYDKYGKPWIVTIHGGGSETDPNWIKATHNNPHVVAVSDYIAKKIGALAHVWTCSDPKDFIYNNKKDDYFLWMAGTDWGEGKGLWSTINLAKKFHFNLKIAGTGQNKENIEAIKKQCDKKIQYVGAANGIEKAKLLANAKALILLTRLNDACPTTVSEAMLSGTPVICSNNGAMPEIIFNGITGFVCSKESEVLKALSKVGSLNPKDCQAIGIESFSSQACAKKYLRLYENIIKYGTVRP